MKHLKKLNAKGFAHWVIPMLAIIVIGGVGTALLTLSHASTSAVSVCGSGYRLIKQSALPGTGQATLYLTVNKNVKKFCAVTISTGSKYGIARYMQASVGIYQPASTMFYDNHDDGKTYKFYAGPVYTSYVGYNSKNYQVAAYGAVGTSPSNQTSFRWIQLTVPAALSLAP